MSLTIAVRTSRPARNRWKLSGRDEFSPIAARESCVGCADQWSHGISETLAQKQFFFPVRRVREKPTNANKTS